MVAKLWFRLDPSSSRPVGPGKCSASAFSLIAATRLSERARNESSESQRAALALARHPGQSLRRRPRKAVPVSRRRGGVWRAYRANQSTKHRGAMSFGTSTRAGARVMGFY